MYETSGLKAKTVLYISFRELFQDSEFMIPSFQVSPITMKQCVSCTGTNICFQDRVWFSRKTSVFKVKSTLSTLDRTLVLEYAVIPAGWVATGSVRQDPCGVHYRAPGIGLAWRVPAAHRVRTVLV